MILRGLFRRVAAIATTLALLLPMVPAPALSAAATFYADNVKMSVASAPGTGTITLNAAISGSQSASTAGVPNGAVVSYYISDGAGIWEIGQGTYSTTGPTLTRGAIWSSSGTGTAINADASALVSLTLIGNDILARPTISGSPTATQFAQWISGTGVKGATLTRHVQFFGSSGSATYTPSANLIYAIMRCTGGGGGSGGISAGSGAGFGSGGGGSGATGEVYASAATIGSSLTLFVGAGGTAGVASGGTGGTGGSSTISNGTTLCSAPGGGGGTGFNNSTVFGEPGNGGSAGSVTGDVAIGGNYGGQGITAADAYSGAGSASAYGGQPGSNIAGGSTGSPGVAGLACGAGASGSVNGATGPAEAGAAGHIGCIEIDEYILN